MKKHPMRFLVRHEPLSAKPWFVLRANVGGDVFVVDQFETQLAAQWKVAELNARENEGVVERTTSRTV